MKSQPLRILHVIGAMNRGGAETLIMNLYRNIDRSSIQFDFLVNDLGCDYDDEIAELGGNVFQIPRYNIANYINYKKECRDFFSKHRYPIVHGHIGLPAAIYLQQAHKTGSLCIAHSHAQNYPLSPTEIVFRISTYPIRFHADYFFACSKQAGIDRFGNKATQSASFHVLKNGIDIQRTTFNNDSRLRIREELGINPADPIFGHVGRLTHIKNQSFLLETFCHILQSLPKAQLLLAGRGEDEEKLKDRAHELGIIDHVHFLGIRADVPDILDAIDVFVFPSFKEGLANAVIEAQASGARCLISTGVPEIARISDSTIFENLDAGPKSWAAKAIDLYNNPFDDRAKLSSAARSAGFDIVESATWLSDFYQHIVRGNHAQL